MSLREFITRRKVLPSWVYRTKGVVWRVVPTDAGVFVGEDRNLETKRASFFCVNQTTGEVLWEGISLDEMWWIGIEAVYHDRVFLHGYSKPDMPEHKKIFALDLFTGRTVWSNDDMRFVLAADDSVFASKDSTNGRTMFELSLQTGSVLRPLENSDEAMRLARSRVQMLHDDEPEFPVQLGYHDIDEQTRALISKHCPQDDVVGPVELIDKDGLVFLSHHERGDVDGQFRNVLKVVDQNAELVFSETLNQHLQNVVPDSFFLQGRMLYFVKERSSFAAVNIDDLKK